MRIPPAFGSPFAFSFYVSLSSLGLVPREFSPLGINGNVDRVEAPILTQAARYFHSKRFFPYLQQKPALIHAFPCF